MTQGTVAPQPAKSSTSQPAAILPSVMHGTVGKLACKCTHKDDADFLIKKDRIVCAACAQEIRCTPPLMGIYKATCACCSSPSIKTTFVLDSSGAYVCTWCGAVR
jgi:hypothetical protein